MRKGHIKILEKARDRKLPEKFLKYLEREDKPLSFYGNAYVFFNVYSEEKDSIEVFEKIDALFSAINPRYIIYHFIYPCAPDISILKQILDYKTDIYTKKNMIALASWQPFTLKEIINILSSCYGPDYDYAWRHYNCLLYDKIEDEKNRKIYLEYLLHPTNEYTKTFLEKMIKHNIPYEYAKTYGFSIGNMPIFSYEYNYPWLAKSFSLVQNTTEKTFIKDEQKILKAVSALQNKLQTEIQLTAHAESIVIKYNYEALNINLKSVEKINFNKEGKRFLAYGTEKIEKLVCFNNNNWFYEEKTKKKLIPLNLKKLFQIFKQYPLCTNEILDNLLLYVEQEKQYAWKDILNIYKNDNFGIVPPILIKNIFDEPNLNTAFSKSYVDGNTFNWNKYGISAGYLYLKGIKKVDKRDFGILKDYILHCNIKKYFTIESLLYDVIAQRAGAIIEIDDKSDVFLIIFMMTILSLTIILTYQ